MLGNSIASKPSSSKPRLAVKTKWVSKLRKPRLAGKPKLVLELRKP